MSVRDVVVGACMQSLHIIIRIYYKYWILDDLVHIQYMLPKKIKEDWNQSNWLEALCMFACTEVCNVAMSANRAPGACADKRRYTTVLKAVYKLNFSCNYPSIQARQGTKENFSWKARWPKSTAFIVHALGALWDDVQERCIMVRSIEVWWCCITSYRAYLS